MGDAGSPYARFKRALRTGNLHLVRTAAAELDAPLQLDDALEVLAVIRAADPERYDRAAARWAAAGGTDPAPADPAPADPASDGSGPR